MKTIRKVLGWIEWPLVFLALLWAVPLLASEVVQAPVYQDGDWWVYSVKTKDSFVKSSDELNGEFEVRYEGGKLKVFQLLDGGGKAEWPYNSGDELRRMIGMSQDKLQSPYLRFPLSQNWEDSFERTASGLRRPLFWTAYHKGSWTDKVFKIERTETAVAPIGPGKNVLNYSFSPQTKSIVEFKSEAQNGTKIEIKLVRFGGVSGIPAAPVPR